MLDFIWKPLAGRTVANSKINFEAKKVDAPKSRQSMALRLTLEMEYPQNVDLVDTLTKANFSVDLPDGFSVDNARLTNVELL